MKTTAIQSIENSMVVKVWNKTFIPVSDFQQASEIVRNFIEDNGHGSSDWCNKSNGNIYNHKGKVVAKISYNGRIWDKDGKPLTQTA